MLITKWYLTQYSICSNIMQSRREWNWCSISYSNFKVLMLVKLMEELATSILESLVFLIHSGAGSSSIWNGTTTGLHPSSLNLPKGMRFLNIGEGLPIYSATPHTGRSCIVLDVAHVSSFLCCFAFSVCLCIPFQLKKLKKVGENEVAIVGAWRMPSCHCQCHKDIFGGIQAN